jgi:predicted TIM-barrel fold metal-dependent hydrolase
MVGTGPYSDAATGIDDEIIDPGRRICDAHHHLWDHPGQRYLLPEFLDDARSGHNVVSSVFIEWRSHYWASGPESLRPVGETEFAAGCGRRADAGDVRACAAIIAHADLTLGDAVAPILDAHERAGEGRFRGIRHVGTWDASEEVRGGPHIAPSGLYRSPAFAQGLRALQRRGLSFDAWVFQTQHQELIDLAQAFPDLPIAYNHTGGVLGVGPYRGRREEMFLAWRKGIIALAEYSNITLKLGGLGMYRSGFPFHGEAEKADSRVIADAWRPWIETAIEAFGADRCMFESNFPVDGASCSYAILWNAFKHSVSAASEDEKDALFHDTAASHYRI